MLVVPPLGHTTCCMQRLVHVVEVPQTFGIEAPHTWLPEHMPHERTLPQPSPVTPQLAFCAAHVVGVQMGVPHWLAMTAPQLCPAGQVPQSSALPQPSPAIPQPMFCAAHVVG